MISPETLYGKMLMKIWIDGGDKEDKMLMDIQKEHYLPLQDPLWVENRLI